MSNRSLWEELALRAAGMAAGAAVGYHITKGDAERIQDAARSLAYNELWGVPFKTLNCPKCRAENPITGLNSSCWSCGQPFL